MGFYLAIQHVDDRFGLDMLRLPRQYVINLDHIKLFMKGEGAYLVMTNDVSIPVARNQKEKLIQRFGWL